MFNHLEEMEVRCGAVHDIRLLEKDLAHNEIKFPF
jgi:hypothetical protein